MSARHCLADDLKLTRFEFVVAESALELGAQAGLTDLSGHQEARSGRCRLFTTFTCNGAR